MEAAGLGVHGPEGWAYRDVTVSLPPGAVLLAAGPAGSGRSSLLLTLAGRMRPTDGRLTVFGYPVPRHSRDIRQLAAVARIGGAVEPEPRLTVGEALAERSLLEAVRVGDSRKLFGEACGLVGLKADRHALVGSLPIAQRTLLVLALALVSVPSLVVIDDVGEGLDAGEAGHAWRAIAAVAAAGVTVAASAADPGPARGLCHTVVRLGRTPETSQGDSEGTR